MPGDESNEPNREDDYQKLGDLKIDGKEVHADFKLIQDPNFLLGVLASVKQWCREIPESLTYSCILGLFYISDRSISKFALSIAAVFAILLWTTLTTSESKTQDVRDTKNKAQRQHDAEDEGDDRGS